MKRNPKWHRDEVLLALHLYFSPNRGNVDVLNPKIIALSKLLNALPLVTNRPDQEKFRNPNGVTLKLSNFKAIDPNYHGKGMTRGSKLDEQMFKKYFNNQDQLENIVKGITSIINNTAIKDDILHIEEDEETLEDRVEEGAILYKYHKMIERSSQIVKLKKREALKKERKLVCEVCGFDFHDRYGDIGKGFIECHHRMPLASLQVSNKTSLQDLAGTISGSV